MQAMSRTSTLLFLLLSLLSFTFASHDEDHQIDYMAFDRRYMDFYDLDDPNIVTPHNATREDEHEIHSFEKRGGKDDNTFHIHKSKNHEAKKAREAAAGGLLPWDQMGCACKVSEQHIPVLGNMGWHFNLVTHGYGDNTMQPNRKEKADYCGKHILDSLHVYCHTKNNIRQWYCKQVGQTRYVSWDSAKTFHHQGVEAAMWDASMQQMGGCACNYNWAGSIAKSVFSSLAMVIPIPGVEEIGLAADIAANVAVSVIKDAAGAGVKAGAEQVVKSAGQAVAKQVTKEALKDTAKDAAKGVAKQAKDTVKGQAKSYAEDKAKQKLNQTMHH